MKLIYLGEEIDSTLEHELCSENEFGFDVTITYTPKSWMSVDNGSQLTCKIFNCTEVHNRYTSFHGERIAFESDIHCTGGTRDIEEIESVVIELATFKSDGYYE